MSINEAFIVQSLDYWLTTVIQWCVLHRSCPVMLKFRLKSALNYEVVMQRNLNFKNCILWRTWIHRDKFNWMLYSSFKIIYCLSLLVALKTEEEDNSYTKARV